MKQKETCGAHLRNLLTPYKNLIAVVDALNSKTLSREAFERVTQGMDVHLDKLIEFSKSREMENAMWRDEE